MELFFLALTKLQCYSKDWEEDDAPFGERIRILCKARNSIIKMMDSEVLNDIRDFDWRGTVETYLNNFDEFFYI